MGITGTPIIDDSTASIFLDAMVAGSSGPRHLVFGLSVRDGSFLPGWPVDVATALTANGQAFNPGDQGQRGALAIVDGVLFVPFGGLSVIAAITMAGLLVFPCVILKL